MRERRID